MDSVGRYRKLKEYWEEVSGGRIQKISLHAGCSCPNRDGTIGFGGCHYCSNEAFTPGYCHEGLALEAQIAEGLAFQRRRYPRAAGFQGYLQAYTNSHGPLQQLIRQYSLVLDHPDLRGLIIGTRPDCLSDGLLDWLADPIRRERIYVEIGIESFSDAILKKMNRGHTFADAQLAVQRLRERGLLVGGHFLVGFPGESWTAFFERLDELNALDLHSVKVHQLHIFRETVLAEWYARRPDDFSFPSKEAYFEKAAQWLEGLNPQTYVDRLFGDAPHRFVVRTGWGERLDRIIAQFEAFLTVRGTHQGSRYVKGATAKSI